MCLWPQPEFILHWENNGGLRISVDSDIDSGGKLMWRKKCGCLGRVPMISSRCNWCLLKCREWRVNGFQAHLGLVGKSCLEIDFSTNFLISTLSQPSLNLPVFISSFNQQPSLMVSGPSSSFINFFSNHLEILKIYWNTKTKWNWKALGSWRHPLPR